MRRILSGRTWGSGAVAMLLLLGTGCLDQFSPDVGAPSVQRCDPSDSDPERDVSFHDEVLPLLRRPKAMGGCSCHDPADTEPVGFEITGLDLTSYDALMAGGVNSGEDIIVPGDPCISVLVQKTGEAPPFGSRMPLAGPPFLTASERQLIHDWVAEGARAR